MPKQEAGAEQITRVPLSSAAKQLLALLQQAHLNAPNDLTSEELEREVTLAHEEAREILRARGR